MGGAGHSDHSEGSELSEGIEKAGSDGSEGSEASENVARVEHPSGIKDAVFDAADRMETYIRGANPSHPLHSFDV